MNHAIPMHFTLEARNESARAVLLRIIQMTHYRFYWLVRNQPLHAGWAINLQPLTEGWSETRQAAGVDQITVEQPE